MVTGETQSPGINYPHRPVETNFHGYFNKVNNRRFKPTFDIQLSQVSESGAMLVSITPLVLLGCSSTSYYYVQAQLSLRG